MCIYFVDVIETKPTLAEENRNFLDRLDKKWQTSNDIDTSTKATTTSIIGGHGFWDKGGVYTLGVSEKNSAAASGGVHRGVNFRKKVVLPLQIENFF